MQSHKQRPLRVGLLFDFDGTLCDTDTIHFDVWRDMLANCPSEQHIPIPTPIDHTWYKNHISGKLNAHIIRELFPTLNDEQGARFSALKEETFRTIAKGQLREITGLSKFLHLWPRDGLVTLDGRKVTVVKCLVTNSPPENVSFMVKELGLENAFDEHIITDQWRGLKGKPNPRPYLLAMQRHGLSSNDCVVFEVWRLIADLLPFMDFRIRWLAQPQASFQEQRLLDCVQHSSPTNYEALDAQELFERGKI